MYTELVAALGFFFFFFNYHSFFLFSFFVIHGYSWNGNVIDKSIDEWLQEKEGYGNGDFVDL